MSNEIKLQPEERLNKSNFEEWEFLITNILKSKKILNYTKSDVVGKIRKKLIEAENLPKDEKYNATIKNLTSQLEDAEANDALACTILITNVSKDILEYIKRLESAFDIMQKLKSLYGNKKSADIQYWMKKMYSLRAKNLFECKDVINQINEIFDIMNRNNANLGEWEKIRILYLSFPKALKDQIHPTCTEKVEQFLSDAINKINFQLYLHSTIDYNKNINMDDDYMDIDLVEPNNKGISYISKNRNFSNKQK